MSRSLGIVADQLYNGSRFRTSGKSLRGSDLVGVMDNLIINSGVSPQRQKVDNGSEFISKILDKWAYENKVELDFSRPGKPTDNPFIESFNGSSRDECLNTNCSSFGKMHKKVLNCVNQLLYRINSCCPTAPICHMNF
jgi:putative transposase